MCMLPTDGGLIYVMGEPERFSTLPLLPFDGAARGFLAQLSARMMADAATRTMPDVMSFAWWCRKANIERLAKIYDSAELRIGRGLAFHVTPTNVPVNFAFSWAFSLLAGNANVVRLPNRDYPQISFIVGHIAALMGEEAFAELRLMNAFVAYGHQEKITEAFSAIADARIVWGGDATIQAIRKSPLPARGVDVCFADRTSLCVLSAARILELKREALEQLASSFYNDTYIMRPERVLVASASGLAGQRGGDRRGWLAIMEGGARAGRAPLRACRGGVGGQVHPGLPRRDRTQLRYRDAAWR